MISIQRDNRGEYFVKVNTLFIDRLWISFCQHLLIWYIWGPTYPNLCFHLLWIELYFLCQGADWPSGLLTRNRCAARTEVPKTQEACWAAAVAYFLLVMKGANLVQGSTKCAPCSLIMARAMQHLETVTIYVLSHPVSNATNTAPFYLWIILSMLLVFVAFRVHRDHLRVTVRSQV